VAGFEDPALPYAGHAYNPAGTPWTFSANSGVAANASAFTYANPPAPEGSQVLFLRHTGSASQAIPGWAAGTYSISFKAARRASHGTDHDFRVLVDGRVVATFDSTSTAYSTFTTPAFAVAEGAHTITFQGINSGGVEPSSSFIDDIRINPVENAGHELSHEYRGVGGIVDATVLHDGSSNTAGNALNFRGLIDDVIVFHRALTGDEVHSLYHGGAPTAAHGDNAGKAREHAAVLALVPRLDATSVAVRSGNWSDPTIWADGTVPAAGDDVLIVDGRTVAYDLENPAALGTIRVDGMLWFVPGVNTRVVADTIVVSPGGTFQVGTANEPIRADVTARIEFTGGAIDTAWDPYLLSRGLVSHGTFHVVGAAKTGHLALAGPALAGADELVLSRVPEGWRVGDRIVLGGTSMDPNGSDADHSRFRDEVLEITSITGDRVRFLNRTRPADQGRTTLIWDHKAPEGYGLDIYVANTTRNIVFDTLTGPSTPIAQRGHVMLMHSNDVAVYAAEFRDLGRTDKKRLVTDPVVSADGVLQRGGENPRARYALHFHRTGIGNLDSPGVAVINCSVVGSPGWGFVNHDSHVDFTDNVAFDVVGAAYSTENGDELGSFRNNISIATTGDARPDLDFDGSDRVSAFDFGFNGEAFWIQGSPGVSMENNIAISAAGGGVNVFSGVDGIKPRLFPVSNVSDPELRKSLQAAGLTQVSVHQLPMPRLAGMRVYNSLYGIIFWNHMRQALSTNGLMTYTGGAATNAAHEGRTVIDDFSLWGIYGTGTFAQYSGQISYRNGLVLGNPASPVPFVGHINGQGRGVGLHSNAAARDIEYLNLRVEGFDRAVRIVDDGQIESGSRIVGGYFANNRSMFTHAEALFTAVAPYPLNFEVSGNPTIVPFAGSSNLRPIARFTAEQAGNLAVSFRANSSADPDLPQDRRLSGNGIAAYSWDFGDGSIGFGASPVHVYNAPGDYTVRLRVHDTFGATSELASTVRVTSVSYRQALLAPDFSGPSSDNYYMSHLHAGTEWRKHRWVNSGGVASVSSAGAAASMHQVIEDRGVRRGPLTLSFELSNLDRAGQPNRIYARVYGVNGRFFLNSDLDTRPAALSARKIESVDLMTTVSLGGRDFDRENFSFRFNAGPGYDYLIVRFYAIQVDSTRGDIVRVRNVSLA
jgi:hypothetical protein